MTVISNTFDMQADASVTRRENVLGTLGFRNVYQVICRDKNGEIRWTETIYNTVTNEGLDDVLNRYFKGSAYTASFSVSLINGSSPSVLAGDTMASHGGWTENQNYSEAVREVLSFGTVASQSVDNTSNVAQFSINSDSQTIGGCFISTDNVKGGSSGVLYAGGSFSGGDQSVNNGDTLDVIITLTDSSV